MAAVYAAHLHDVDRGTPENVGAACERDTRQRHWCAERERVPGQAGARAGAHGDRVREMLFLRRRVCQGTLTQHDRCDDRKRKLPAVDHDRLCYGMPEPLSCEGAIRRQKLSTRYIERLAGVTGTSRGNGGGEATPERVESYATPRGPISAMSFCEHCEGQRFDRAQVLRTLREVRRQMRAARCGKKVDDALTTALKA